jgi:hypothetical protein
MSGEIPVIDPAKVTLQGGGNNGILFLDNVTVGGKTVLRFIPVGGGDAKYIVKDAGTNALIVANAIA